MGGPLSEYDGLIEAGKLREDAGQRIAAVHLQAIL